MRGKRKTLNAKDYQDISIWVDKYEDLFSDYDSRDFTERALSDDFILEVRKLVREMPSENIELKFNLLIEPSNPETEAIITKNIHEHFAFFAEVIKDEMDTIFRNGCIMTGLGFALIVALIYVGNVAEANSFLSGSHVALEPIGWFLAWTGLDMMFQQSKKEQETIQFNLKMTKANISYASFGIPLDLMSASETTEGTVETTITTTNTPSKVIPCGNSLRIAS
ncbi:MAG: hypothetical protein NTY88_09790 [Bacteroidetes bacterium]|nr:hypothetical protein [Bacteroidota bacterium]